MNNPNDSKPDQTGIIWKRAVMTGATGMIGLALTKLLREIGIEVTVLVRADSPRQDLLKTQVGLKVIGCSLSELESVKSKLEGRYDAFFHLGWESTFGSGRNDMYQQNRNVKYTLDAAELAYQLGCRVFVGAGSQAEYGPSEQILSAKTPAFPITGYGIAKLCAGQMSREVCSAYGIRHVWCRILSVYGPYDNPGTMIMTALRTYLAGQEPAFTKGEQQWDYLYSKDCAAALLAAARSGRHRAVYPVGSGMVKPLADYIRVIRDTANPAVPLGIGRVSYRQGQVMHLQADIRELTLDTGFEPQVDFREGIKRTITWYKEEMQL